MKSPTAEMPSAAPEGTALTVAAGLDPQMAGLMKIALEKGTVDSLEKLVALAERVENRNAAREFGDAKARFQSMCPPIRKTSTMKVVSKRTGTERVTPFAALDEIARTVGPHLHSLGLSYSWDSVVEAGFITVTCTLRHLNGHSERATFKCPVDGQESMSEPQKYASTLTFARRYSLIEILGLTTCDADDDAAKKPKAGTGRINPERVADLEALLEEVKADRVKFLAYMNVEAVEEIAPADYSKAVKALEAKRRGGAA